MSSVVKMSGDFAVWLASPEAEFLECGRDDRYDGEGGQ